MKIILASQSSSRKKALDILGLKYEIKPSHFDEKSLRFQDPKKLARLLAEAKAYSINEENNIVIAGDLFVVFRGKIIEKPKDKTEAFQMLKSFSGKELKVIASLAVLKSRRMLSTVSECKVHFRELSDYEIKDYISRYKVVNYAGAFDGDGMLRFANHVNGSLNFITAFP
ncbi:MAG: septum formation protein Maf, partial [Candidatus Aenigmarchaeota archaeon]|nr:septum formation protein Maf [Candidatus Aenigmarchaeota archaeon]